MLPEEDRLTAMGNIKTCTKNSMETGRVVQEICAWRQTRPDAGRVKPGNNLQHRSSEY